MFCMFSPRRTAVRLRGVELVNPGLDPGSGAERTGARAGPSLSAHGRGPTHQEAGLGTTLQGPAPPSPVPHTHAHAPPLPLTRSLSVPALAPAGCVPPSLRRNPPPRLDLILFCYRRFFFPKSGRARAHAVCACVLSVRARVCVPVCVCVCVRACALGVQSPRLKQKFGSPGSAVAKRRGERKTRCRDYRRPAAATMIRVALLLLLALAGPFCAVAHASTLVPASALEDAPVTEASVALEATPEAAAAAADPAEAAEPAAPAAVDATEPAPEEAAAPEPTDAPAAAPAEAAEPSAAPEAPPEEVPAEVPGEVPAELSTEVPAEASAAPAEAPAEAAEDPEPATAAAEPAVATQPPAPEEPAAPVVTEPPAVAPEAPAAPAQAEETAADPTVLVEVTEDGMGTGQVVGIVIGSLLALIIVIVVVVSVIRRMGRYSSSPKKTKKSKAQENILVSPLRRKTGKKEKEGRPVFWKLNY
ncbi:calphotin isoform X1 [Anguilla anguilla]|uniref:calphotin isoform X1 n=1 Tax=Anguilla anguilla TaxID=7936 RepID=UPI0015A900EF|nr:calphotin isoform X1 [Anguilla anguilla]